MKEARHYRLWTVTPLTMPPVLKNVLCGNW